MELESGEWGTEEGTVHAATDSVRELEFGAGSGRRGCVRDSHVTQTEAALRDAARRMLGEHGARAGHRADRLGSTNTPS